MVKQLMQPILNGGIPSIHFFNGRLLSGEDLSAEQKANRQARQLLGKALSDGVAYGLEVKEAAGASRKQEPVVTVEAGLAINRQGQAIHLAVPIDVALVRPQQSGAAPVNALFAECKPLDLGPYVVGAGAYLLTIQPGSGPDGRAPVSGLGNLDAACNARYQVEGVLFRLIQLFVSASDMGDSAHLRNQIAYRCLGANNDEIKSFFANPFGPIVNRYGLLDDLRPGCLTDAEVPLAVLYWTVADGLRFIDLWSVRRRITQPSPDGKWPVLTSDRRMAEAEAMFLQFEEHIESLRTLTPNTLGDVQATDHFMFLPPVGLLPVQGVNSPGGFNQGRFFGKKASKDVALIDATTLHELLGASLAHEPIDLSRSEKIQLYLIYENIRAVELLQTSQLVLVFASHLMPYRGVARFGYAKTNLSRFATHII